MKRRTGFVVALAIATIVLMGFGLTAVSQQRKEKVPVSGYVVLGFNDLGMHCMNQDFSEFMILPPYNNLYAQVIERSMPLPRLVTQGVTVEFSIPGNTESAFKTNFWDYVQALLGVSLPPNIGLAGTGLSGAMTAVTGAWLAEGIPLTPQTDAGPINPFQLANIVVKGSGGAVLAGTKAVVPVSWELRCDFCHNGMDAPLSVLDAHDRLHATTLFQPGNQPVLCGSCHAQPELGLAGDSQVSTLSRAMHHAHSTRMMDVVALVPKGVACYACHPGPQTECLRDVHARMQVFCGGCHAPGAATPEAEMLAVADPARRPWADLPRCDNCHKHPGWDYEQPGMLFKNSIGHGGLRCEACHNSTHAIVPARDDADNAQSIAVQHFAGSIRDCSFCHASRPYGIFRHAAPVMSAPASRKLRDAL